MSAPPKRFGLTKTKLKIPHETLDLIERRTQPFIGYHLSWASLGGLDAAIQRIAQDCYLQGIRDIDEAHRRRKE